MLGREGLHREVGLQKPIKQRSPQLAAELINGRMAEWPNAEGIRGGNWCLSPPRIVPLTRYSWFRETM